MKLFCVCKFNNFILSVLFLTNIKEMLYASGLERLNWVTGQAEHFLLVHTVNVNGGMGSHMWLRSEAAAKNTEL